MKSIIWYPASIRLSISFWSKVDSDAAFSPVDLTGNVIMIEKLVLIGTGAGDFPIFSPMHKLLRHQDTLDDIKTHKDNTSLTKWQSSSLNVPSPRLFMGWTAASQQWKVDHQP